MAFICLHTNQGEILALALNTTITICTEIIGSVHSATLKWTLAHERRVEFNVNLRLLTASTCRFSANGIIANVFMTILLILSFSAAPMIAYFDVAASRMTLTCPLSFFWVFTCSYRLSLPYRQCCPRQLGRGAATRSSSLQPRYFREQAIAKDDACSALTNAVKTPVMPVSRQISAWDTHKSVERLSWFFGFSSLSASCGLLECQLRCTSLGLTTGKLSRGAGHSPPSQQQWYRHIIASLTGRRAFA